jgi:hypothetical protein
MSAPQQKTAEECELSMSSDDSSVEDDCTICLEETGISLPCVKTGCTGKICISCLVQHANSGSATANLCPFCRHALAPTPVAYTDRINTLENRYGELETTRAEESLGYNLAMLQMVDVVNEMKAREARATAQANEIKARAIRVRALCVDELRSIRQHVSGAHRALAGTLQDSKSAAPEEARQIQTAVTVELSGTAHHITWVIGQMERIHGA